MTFRSCLYSKNKGDGTPYLLPNGEWDAEALDDLAEYDVVITDFEPWSLHQIPLQEQLRLRNPDIELIGWCAGLCPWKNPNPAHSDKGSGDFPWLLWESIDKVSGWLVKADGSLWTCPALPGKYIPDLRKAHVRSAYIGALVQALPGWDGVFLDMFCPSLLAINGQANLPPGYVDSEWQAGHAAFLHELWMANQCVIIGNSGPGPTHPLTKGFGWMRENFPLQSGGTWHKNMHGYEPSPGDKRPGYLSQGEHAIISIMPNHNSEPDDQRRAEFAVCSALLGAGMATIVGDASDPLRSFRPKHYAIYDSARRIGEPLSGGLVDYPNGLCVREYEHGTVFVNPTASTIRVHGATFGPQSGAIL